MPGLLWDDFDQRTEEGLAGEDLGVDLGTVGHQLRTC